MPGSDCCTPRQDHYLFGWTGVVHKFTVDNSVHNSFPPFPSQYPAENGGGGEIAELERFLRV